MPGNAVGHVVAVHGPKIKVELAENVRSPVRSGADGAQTVVAINSYLTFELGGGDTALGVITDLDSRERWDPAEGELTLELVKPRRIATVQLLGTVRGVSTAYDFDPGITVLPTLDTGGEPATSEVLEAVFANAPYRNVPPGSTPADFDGSMTLGRPAAVEGHSVVGSYNDLFSRPLAVVGNTGSGKSCTIARVVQQAAEHSRLNRPHFFILDINGEYAAAFGQEFSAEPNKMYVNGTPFCVPLWLMNAHEVCEWLSASEQTQEPVLKNVWSIAKGGTSADGRQTSNAGEAAARLGNLKSWLRNGGRFAVQNCRQSWRSAVAFLNEMDGSIGAQERSAISSAIDDPMVNEAAASFGAADREILTNVESLLTEVESYLGEEAILRQESADQPRYFPVSTLQDPATLFAEASTGDDDRSMDQFLRGLRLRLQNRLRDPRWEIFRNYDELAIGSLDDWLARMGIGAEATGSQVTVVDLSMVAAEVLPYACGIIGRILLELREHANPDVRFHEPWVVVLEEAHNYVRPRRQVEDRGITISRDAFERLAKEGRKFGLSLVVASQRPSEISPTVLSQCANFVMHRLQNPEDIEHFRSIVPSQSRRLLDQASVLAAGEAIVLGSGFHVPSRVRIDLPDMQPSSRSSTPHRSWKDVNEQFDRESAIANWLAGPTNEPAGPSE